MKKIKNEIKDPKPDNAPFFKAIYSPFLVITIIFLAIIMLYIGYLYLPSGLPDTKIIKVAKYSDPPCDVTDECGYIYHTYIPFIMPIESRPQINQSDVYKITISNRNIDRSQIKFNGYTISKFELMSNSDYIKNCNDSFSES